MRPGSGARSEASKISFGSAMDSARGRDLRSVGYGCQAARMRKIGWCAPSPACWGGRGWGLPPQNALVEGRIEFPPPATHRSAIALLSVATSPASGRGEKAMFSRIPDFHLKTNFASRINVIWGVQMDTRKYFLSGCPQIKAIIAPSRLP